ncbi:MAG: hypothetical protein E6Q43_00300 [Dokdonella sp.]|nr:MAG: hypothetical protein EYC71_06875 [Gammaproteobacteria bacterium]TXI78013.1 MAG: hypothetical protein E6Q43_00300 [Dokdonella sp.]
MIESDDPPPQKPDPPDPGDCCGGGCVRCVFDVHEDALERYREALAAWRVRHPDVKPAE